MPSVLDVNYGQVIANLDNKINQASEQCPIIGPNEAVVAALTIKRGCRDMRPFEGRTVSRPNPNYNKEAWEITGYLEHIDLDKTNRINLFKTIVTKNNKFTDFLLWKYAVITQIYGFKRNRGMVPIEKTTLRLFKDEKEVFNKKVNTVKNLLKLMLSTDIQNTIIDILYDITDPLFVITDHDDNRNDYIINSLIRQFDLRVL